jgi:hypothetical protein
MATTRIPIPAGRITPLISATWQARWGLRNLHNVGNNTIFILAENGQGGIHSVRYSSRSSAFEKVAPGSS